jgi:UDP-sugar diphosphatase
MNEKIKILKTQANLTSKYIQPFSVFFIEDGQEKRWDYIKTHDSVACLLYHTQKEAFLLVKQFRPAVYLEHRGETDGFTYEMCAGILDKDKSSAQTMQEEILEECGYDVPIENIDKITSFYSVGYSGAKQTFYFAHIDETMKKNDGGGIHDERIELFFLPIREAQNFIYDDKKPKSAGTMFALVWFFEKMRSSTN